MPTVPTVSLREKSKHSQELIWGPFRSHESSQAGIDSALEFIWNLVKDYTDECRESFSCYDFPDRSAKYLSEVRNDQNDMDRFASESPATR